MISRQSMWDPFKLPQRGRSVALTNNRRKVPLPTESDTLRLVSAQLSTIMSVNSLAVLQLA